jgi:hypothetical protein
MNIFRSQIAILLASWFGLLLTACSGAPVIHPLPSSGVTVNGDKIYHDGKPFAEIRCYFTIRSSENPGEAYLFWSSTQHRGIAMYYFDEENLVWIFPKRGLEEDIRCGHFIANGESEGKLGWVFDVSISPDGKTVDYKKPGIFSASSYEYSVETGVSR